MDSTLEKFVKERASHRCEYCHLPQSISEWRFHIEHIVAVQHGGRTVLNNLALACPRCNLHKGTNLASVDERTGQRVWLFHPRRHRWRTHFRWDFPFVVGKTTTGRATVSLLRINVAEELEVRRQLSVEVEFPLADDL